MTTFTFTTRETYLQYRAEWKCQYAELSTNQRETKNKIKLSMRNKAPYLRGAAWQFQAAEITNKNEANRMLDALKEAKVEAQRQFTLSKL